MGLWLLIGLLGDPLHAARKPPLYSYRQQLLFAPDLDLLFLIIEFDDEQAKKTNLTDDTERRRVVWDKTSLDSILPPANVDRHRMEIVGLRGL